MPTNYPYVSSPGAIVKAFEQFRKSFPATMDSDTLKKFQIAPANESYVISTFRFLGLIDEEGKRVSSATDFFYSDDQKFAEGLEVRVQDAYGALFSDHGESAWTESKDTLSTWFRITDKTSDLVGGRQAGEHFHHACRSRRARRNQEADAKHHQRRKGETASQEELKEGG